MTHDTTGLDDQLDAAWQESMPIHARLGKALDELEQELADQQKLRQGRWPTRTDTLLFWAQQAHEAQADLNRNTKKITTLQEAIRATYL